MILFTLGDKSFQCNPDEAILHALNIIKISESARTERNLIKFLIERVGIKPDQIATVVRQFREDRRKDESQKQSIDPNGISGQPC